MAFVMPGGDYERALRLAGASNFMEAFESGVDRNLRRRGQREGLRQQRDLYDRQVAEEEAGYTNDALAGIEALARDRAAQAQQAGAVEAALAEGVAVAQGAPLIQAVPAQAQQGVVAATTPILGVAPAVRGDGPVGGSGWSDADMARLAEIGFAGSANPENMLAAARRYRAAGDEETANLLEARAGFTQGGSVLGSMRNRLSTDLFPPRAAGPELSSLGPVAPPAEKPWWWGGGTYEEAFPAREPERTLGPRRAVDWKTLPPEEFALATPRGESQREVQIKEALRLISEDRTIDAQERLGTSAQAYPGLGVESVTEGSPIPFDASGSGLGRALKELIEQGRYVEAQSLVKDGQVYPSLDVETATMGGAPIDERPVPSDWMAEPIALGLPPGGGDAALDGVAAATQAASAIGATFPGGGGSSAIQAAGLDAAVNAAIRQAEIDQTPGLREAVEGVVAPAPATSLQRMADRAKEFESPEFGVPRAMVDEAVEEVVSPLEAAIATGAEASERAELVGPEVEVDTAPVEVIDEKTGKVHTVKPGEYVYGIAKSYGASPQALIKANQSLFIGKDGKVRSLTTKGGKTLAGADLIFPGEKLRIPTGEGRETGGPAGPVDTREGAKEGVLAKAEKGAKSEKEVVARLEKEQAKRTDVPLNPFQAFGRDIGYTPSLKAVAYATRRAEQGDFSMINMMAGRVVKNAELPGLFARYSNFASGARRRSKEIVLEEKLAKETQANEVKQRAAMGVRTMAFTQFQRAGHGLEDAQVFAGHYADLWAFDPQQARAWSTSLNAMGAELAKAEAARLKRGGFRGAVGPDGRGTEKQIKAAVSEQRGLVKSRNDALSQLVRISPLSQGIVPTPEELTKMESNPTYGLAARAYREADEAKLYGDQRLHILRYGRPEPGPDADKDGAAGDLVSIDQILAIGAEDLEKVKSGLMTVDAWVKTLNTAGVKFDEAALRAFVEPEIASTAPLIQRSPAEVSEKLAEVRRGTPLSRKEEQRQSRETVQLRREGRRANLQKSREDLTGKMSRVTNSAEDILLRLNAGERVSSDEKRSALSALRSLLSELKTFKAQGAEEGGTLRVPGIVALRRGVPVSEDIEETRFLIRRLSR